MADPTEPVTDSSPRRARQKVLIFTATAGGGHVAAARAVRDALEGVGHRAVILDGLEVMSHRLKWFQVDCYAWQLAHTPWSYGVGFRGLGFRPVAATVRFLIGFLWGDRLLAAIAAEQPDIIVSTYPVVTAGLGRLIAADRLSAPVVAVVTDFGAHPLWVSPQVDLHLVPCRRTLDLVERAGGQGRVMDFPVGERFRTDLSQEQARAALGLPADAVISLIVGGAWGVGDIEGAAAASVVAGAYPIVVTADNAELRTSLERRFPDSATARILSWTDEMPALMAAADCLIQSAGGVTCLEAMAVDLPILFYRPIPGHGGFNARIMEEASAARRVAGRRDLAAVLRETVAGTMALAPPRRDPGCCVATAVLTAAPRGRRPIARPWAWHPRPLLAAAMLALLLWVSFSPWVMGLAAGRTPLPVLDGDVPPGTVAVVVRTDDPTTAAALERAIDLRHLPVALFVDAEAAAGLTPDAGLTFGVAEETRGGRLDDPVERWRRTRAGTEALAQATGITPRYFLPATDRPALVDIALAPRHTRVLVGIERRAETLRPGIVVVEATGLPAAAAVAAVEQQLAQVAAAGLRPIPLAAMS